MSEDPTAATAEQLRRHGLLAPAHFLLAAHRPLRPLLSHLATFAEPLLRPVFGSTVSGVRATLDDPDLYDRLVERLEHAAREGR